MKFFTINTVIIDIAEVIYKDDPFIVVTKLGETYNYQEPAAVIYELETIPDNIIPQKYCYVNEEFIINVNWVDSELYM